MQRIIIIALTFLCIFGRIEAQYAIEMDKTRFIVTPKKVEFPNGAGEKTISIDADQEWKIDQRPAGDWAYVKKTDNKKLTVSVKENTSKERRVTKFRLISGKQSVEITVSQEGAKTAGQTSDEKAGAKPKPDIFNINSTYANFSAYGGSKTFTVTSSKAWSVSYNPDSWCRLSRNGNTLYLEADSYSRTDPRSTSFKIKSGSKTITVNINQSGARDRLDISSNSAEFSADGGTKTFTVTSNGSWQTDRLPDPSVAHLSRNGNIITLKVDRNSGTSPRNSYFTIRSSAGTIQRVDIYQSGIPASLTISSTSAKFNGDGGTETFIIDSNTDWEIGTRTLSWGHLSRNGKNLTLKVDANKTTSSRSDYFTLEYGNKVQRIDIFQDEPDLLVNDGTNDITLDFSPYGGSKKIKIHCKNGQYNIGAIPKCCKIESRTENGFTLRCGWSNSVHDEIYYMAVESNGKRIWIKINQGRNWDKYIRRENGGWVNMAIGMEGGYPLSGDSWFANGVVGLRIGNYKDLFSGEIGVEPGFINLFDNHIDAGEVKFHLPVYASLKLSVPTGKFYLKVGGAYNVIRNDSESRYTLRAGFGTGWKHVDWDWAFIQFNDDDLFDFEKACIGMRLTFYLTR